MANIIVRDLTPYSCSNSFAHNLDEGQFDLHGGIRVAGSPPPLPGEIPFIIIPPSGGRPGRIKVTIT